MENSTLRYRKVLLFIRARHNTQNDLQIRNVVVHSMFLFILPHRWIWHLKIVQEVTHGSSELFTLFVFIFCIRSAPASLCLHEGIWDSYPRNTRAEWELVAVVVVVVDEYIFFKYIRTRAVSHFYIHYEEKSYHMDSYYKTHIWK